MFPLLKRDCRAKNARLTVSERINKRESNAASQKGKSLCSPSAEKGTIYRKLPKKAQKHWQRLHRQNISISDSCVKAFLKEYQHLRDPYLFCKGKCATSS